MSRDLRGGNGGDQATCPGGILIIPTDCLGLVGGLPRGQAPRSPPAPLSLPPKPQATTPSPALGILTLSVDLDAIGVGSFPVAAVLVQLLSIRSAPFTKALAASLLCSRFHHTLYWIPSPTYWSFVTRDSAARWNGSLTFKRFASQLRRLRAAISYLQ
jgi:hypothetical protein